MSIDPFRKIFEKYRGKSVPKSALLKDALEEAGVASGDTERAMSTLQRNLECVGAVTDVSGKPHIDMPSFDSTAATGHGGPPSGTAKGVGASNQSRDSGSGEPGSPPVNNRPQLHIDVQVHIDSSASAEQIDQIFKSMATHLYGSGYA